MNGFDKWTSSMTPERIAKVISYSPCVVVADFCPLYYECPIEPDGMKFTPDAVSKCYEKLCEYFDKELEE